MNNHQLSACMHQAAKTLVHHDQSQTFS